MTEDEMAQAAGNFAEKIVDITPNIPANAVALGLGGAMAALAVASGDWKLFVVMVKVAFDASIQDIGEK